MGIYKIVCGAALVVLAVSTAAPPAVARACVFDWAVPGSYDISGNFRGQVETVTARLTHDCRVSIGVPGVFTGGPLKRAGRCLEFSFRVEGERRTFTARWCGNYGVVPWQGRNIRATIVRRPTRSVPDTR